MDYSRGLLNHQQAESVRAHLKSCAECRAALADEVRLVKRLSVVPSQVGPESDVWPLVHAKLAPSRSRFGVLGGVFGAPARRLVMAGAALVVLVAALFSISMWQISSSERQSIAQARELMHVQPVAKTASSWTDDPFAGTTDAMMKVLEDETRPQ